jgi:hypothetical protein
MENIIDQIGAAKARLAYQKMMVEAGRGSNVLMEKALNEVVELEKAHFVGIKKEADNIGVKIDEIFVDEVAGINGAVFGTAENSAKDPYLTAKSDLAVEIRRLTELEAEKSNALAMAPIDSPQPYLCGELVAGRRKIEGLWDQLYELERTGQLPAPPIPSRPLTGDELVDKELKLSRIAKDLDSMRNIRQKASKALRDAAGNTIDKEKFQLNVEKYTAKIAGCDAEIDRLEKERNILLGR